MFFGEYHHQMDDKGRFRIPAKLKANLGDRYLITKGANGCLYVFPEEEVQRLYEKSREPELNNFAAQRLLRELFSSGIQSDEDNQGRMMLTPELRKFAKINKNIVTIGVATRIEIWSEEVWKEYTTQSAEDFDEMMLNSGKVGF